MAFKPGSFSKNFAWHGKGLSKLQIAIASGFNSSLKAITRGQFRKHCGIPEPDLQLIPINFFLFNIGPGESDFLAIDELIRYAISQPHTLDFDRLALFALHLSLVGKAPSGGCPWARKYVIEHLGKEGFWALRLLDVEPLDRFLNSELDATTGVRVKCRSNYRHLFELTRYMSDSETHFDGRNQDWVPNAIILSWDRAILSGGLGTPVTGESLIMYLKAQRIHRLLSVPEEFAIELGKRIAPAYLANAGISRFEDIAEEIGELPSKAHQSRTPVNKPKNRAKRLGMIAAAFSVSEVSRSLRMVNQQDRNTELAAALKDHYDSNCMFCGGRIWISLSPERFYAEAAHIRPLGRPHNGHDAADNMLVLCPNCHVQFDEGVLWLRRISERELQIQSWVPKHILAGKRIELKGEHQLRDENIRYHARRADGKHGKH